MSTPLEQQSRSVEDSRNQTASNQNMVREFESMPREAQLKIAREVCRQSSSPYLHDMTFSDDNQPSDSRVIARKNDTLQNSASGGGDDAVIAKKKDALADVPSGSDDAVVAKKKDPLADGGNGSDDDAVIIKKKDAMADDRSSDDDAIIAKKNDADDGHLEMTDPFQAWGAAIGNAVERIAAAI